MSEVFLSIVIELLKAVGHEIYVVTSIHLYVI